MNTKYKSSILGKLLSFLLLLLVICSIYSITKMSAWETPVFNTIAGNEIVQEVQANWDQLKSLSDSSFEYPFSVIDSQDNLLYQTPYSDSSSINEAYKNCNIIIDITKDHQVIGKVLISTFYHQSLKELQRKILFDLLIVFSCIFVVFLFSILLINHFMLKPFGKLKQFASEISSGNLDAPLEMDRHNLFGAFTESFDIMREELSLANKREHIANQKKKELVASLSHDIKTPVTSIKLISELLLSTDIDLKIAQKLRNIYAKADQIDSLVTDMFHSTLEDLGELKVNLSEELSTIVEPIIENTDFKHLIQKEVVPHCLIKTDKVRLTQVINNIITNSYKYAHTKIVISYHFEDNYLFMNITDFGPGVDELEIPYLFHKFYRSNSSDVQSQTGSGLGLYIAKQLMNSMEGDISCSNTNNGFLVQLAIKLA